MRYHGFVSTVCVVLALFTIQYTNARDLLQVTLLHRHGARTEPIVTEDELLSWGGCVLSDTGVRMALSLGQFTKAKYVDLLPSTYDERVIVSVTTDFERTIRTGFGCLRGMYNGSDEIPFLAHKTANYDYLMGYYYSWPSANLGLDFINSYNAANNAKTLSFFSQANLDVVGDELHCPILCGENQTTCSLFGEDVTTCRLSNGGLTQNLEELLPEMFQAQILSNSFLYLYNKSSLYWSQTGPYGRLLAVEIYDQYNATLAAYSPNDPLALPSVKMYHYSAHDVTIYSFFTAIGVITLDTTQENILVPTFASAVYLELYSDGNISVQFYESNQRFGSAYNYSEVSNIFLGCKTTPPSSFADESGIYYATECPLEHYKNYVDTMTPQSLNATNNAPWCYQDPDFMALTQCYPNASNLPSDDCLSYRKICEPQSCDTAQGFVLNRVSYTCEKMFNFPDQKSSISVGVYVGVPLSSFAMGAVIGMMIRCIVFERRSKALHSATLLPA